MNTQSNFIFKDNKRDCENCLADSYNHRITQLTLNGSYDYGPENNILDDFDKGLNTLPVICIPLARYNPKRNKWYPEYAFGLIDSGSTHTLISDRAAEALNLKTLSADVEVDMKGASGKGISKRDAVRLDVLTPDKKRVFVGFQAIKFGELPTHYHLNAPIVPNNVDINTLNCPNFYPRHANSFDIVLGNNGCSFLECKLEWNYNNANHRFHRYTSRIYGDVYFTSGLESITDYYPHKNHIKNVRRLAFNKHKPLPAHLEVSNVQAHNALACTPGVALDNNEPLGDHEKVPKIYNYLEDINLCLYDGSKPKLNIESYLCSIDLVNDLSLEENTSLFGPKMVKTSYDGIGKRQIVQNYSSQKNLTKLGIIAELWAKQHEIERFSNDDMATAENVRASDMINNVLTLDEKEKRFHTKLLIRSEQLNKLINNYQNTLARFNAMERKIKNNPEAKLVVQKEFQKFFDMKVLTEVNDEDPHLGNYKHYLPWKVVEKPDSTSSPYRIVFDAGASTGQCKLSLNDIILDTPNVLENLASIELNARWRKNIILSDIKKLYLQIKVDYQSSNLLRCLYRDPFNPHEKIRVYSYKCIIWGVKCSGYQACVAIRKLFKKRAENLHLEFPNLSEKARSLIASDLEYLVASIYVDDVIVSHEDPNEVIRLFKLAQSTLEMGSMKLCKISSNNPELLKIFPEEIKEKVVKFITKNKNPPFLEYSIDVSENCSILGYQYCPGDDCYYFEKYVPLADQFKMPMTKIDLASLLPRFYDNLNLLGPWKCY